MEELLRFCHIAAKDQSEYELIDLNLAVYAGEIVVLSGLHGSGKHLIKGLLQGTSPLLYGTIYLNEAEVPLLNARICAKNGLYYLDSSLSLVPSISVCDNLFLMRPHSFPHLLYPEKAARRETEHLLKHYDFPLNPLAKVYELSAFEQFMCSLIKFLSGNARLLLLDMNTFSFRESEYLRLLDLLAKERANNRSFLLLCSQENPLCSLADRYVLLDRGRDVKLLFPKETACISNKKALLTGPKQIKGKQDSCHCIVTASHLQADTPPYVCGNDSAPTKPLFEAYPGDIIGFYSEAMNINGMLANFLNWMEQNQAQITHNGRIISCKPPVLRYIPENSYSLLFPNLSVEENLLLPRYPRIAGPFGYLSQTMQDCSYTEFLNYFQLEKPIRNIREMGTLTKRLLSIYRFINASTKLILVENPELGLDPPGLAILMQYIKELSQQGILMILTSNQLPILKEYCCNIIRLE